MYCHRVVHWNPPFSPVDLEQREGRVHRYKGHVIRRILAKRYGLSAIPRASDRLIDPWEHLSERVRRDRPKDANDLEPCWIFEPKGRFKNEWQILLLPLQRVVSRAARTTECFYGTATYSAEEEDLGIGRLSWRRPSTCIWMASCMRRAA